MIHGNDERPDERKEGERRSNVRTDGSPNWPLLLPASVKIGAIAGCMKSGTTWLMNLLDEHPRIISSGEMHLLSNPSSAESLMQSPAHEDGDEPSQFTLQAILNGSSNFDAWARKGHDCWREYWGVDADEHSRQLRIELLRLTFELSAAKALARSEKADVQWVFDKSPIHAADFLASFEECFQPYERGVIHLVRDPRDVVISRWYHLREEQRRLLETAENPLSSSEAEACLQLLKGDEAVLTRDKHFFTEPDFFRHTCREWTLVNDSLLRRGTTGQSIPLLVRYEDLRTNRDSALGRIWRFLGLPLETPPGTTDTRSEERKRPSTFRRATGGEWKTWFNEDDHAIMLEECGELMPQFGYDPASR